MTTSPEPLTTANYDTPMVARLRDLISEEIDKIIIEHATMPEEETFETPAAFDHAWQEQYEAEYKAILSALSALGY